MVDVVLCHTKIAKIADFGENNYLCYAWFSIHDHTSFCISAAIAGHMQYAPGWTLRDAIETYCRWFKVDRSEVILERPFLPQRMLMDDEQY